MKKRIIIYLLLIISIFSPINVWALSDYIVAGGNNIGIEVNTDGIIVVGTYDILNKSPAVDAGLLVGDKIIKINDSDVHSINEMLDVINDSNSDSVKIAYVRGNTEYETKLNLIMSDNILKTGMYVKDSVSGIGTLTFIDPDTKMYGALGHEILESSTKQKLEIKDGKIYSSVVTGVTPSKDGNPGEKNARYDSNNIFGNIVANTKDGIFGEYTEEFDQDKLYKVADIEDIKLGPAKIRTVIDNDLIEEFDIKILKVNIDDDKTKNILFEVTDKKLLEKTGGIVQGMSGSPIIQDNFIIGAVTHVVVNSPTLGYGIFIKNMLDNIK